MTDILDNVASESSDNEEIIKLFPRCKPKVSSDFNLNKIAAYHSDTCGVGESNGNDTELMQSNVDSEAPLNHKAADYVNAFISSMECQRARKMDGLCNDEKVESSCPEDHSVVSGYDTFGICQDQLMGRRDSAMDIGQELSPSSGGGSSTYQEFKLRESRIEIAGGREVFSSSRSRLPKKRYSDEIVYQNSSATEKELKRHSGEMHYDEKLNSYRLRSSRNYPPKYNSNDVYGAESLKPSSNSWQMGGDVSLPHNIWESSDSLPKTDSKDIVTLQECRSGLVVYETPVRGSEVIYDDIGDWTDSTGNGSVRNHGFSEIGELRESKVGKELTASTEALNSEDGISPHSCHSPVSKPVGKMMDSFPFANGKLPNCSGAESAQSPEQDLSSSDEMGNDAQELSIKLVTRGSTLIGTIPIAEYEGSPRRYGPRPGHPHRVVTEIAPTSGPTLKQETEDRCPSPGSKQSDIVDTSSLSKSKGVEDACSLKMGLLAGTNLDCTFLDSETQKVLQEFYKQDTQDPSITGPDFSELEYKLYRMSTDNSYVGRRLAQFYSTAVEESPKRVNVERFQRFLNSCSSSQDSVNKPQTVLDSLGSGYIPSPSDLLLLRQHEDRSLLDPFDHDCDTISTNPDTEDLAETEMGEQVGQSRNFTLSPETTDCDSNDVESEVSFENEDSLNSGSRAYGSMPVLEDGLSSGQASDAEDPEMDSDTPTDRRRHHSADNPTTLLIKKQISEIEKEFARCGQRKASPLQSDVPAMQDILCPPYATRLGLSPDDADLDYLDPLRRPCSPPSPAPSQSSDKDEEPRCQRKESVDEAIKEIKQAILKSKSIPMKSAPIEQGSETEQPVWIPRPLFSQQQQFSADDSRKPLSDKEKNEDGAEDECDTDQETDRLLGKQRTEEERDKDHRKKGRSKEVLIHEPAVLIEGVLFRARYLGSTQLVCEGQPTKATRMMQAEEAVSRIKSLAPEGENQPSTEVDLFISTEKIMVLNTDLKEIMMDHSLRTISYIADIGDLVVLMARRRMVGGPEETDIKLRHTPKMICHVFESDEAQFIAQSIGQAFQVAYMEFLKANGIEDHSFVKEMDYQEVLNSQEIYGDELEMFAKKEMQKEVIVPKARGEILGVVIVESGWGSMLPTVVIANLSPNGAAARCGQLNIGDQIIAINGISLVGLPLSTCQNYIKNAKTQMVVKLTVVPCAPVVEVKIKRPDTKYQLGFSVQNGVICSLLRGGIAERGGVRVGHRIIEINGQSVVAVPHERIVNLLATSVGEILMKTMPTSMFRLLTGQETPLYI